MRKLIFYLLVAAPFSMMAQKVEFKDLPEGVQASFNSLYKDVKTATWEKEGDYYEAEFILNEMKAEAVFYASGSQKNVTYEMPAQYIPGKISEYLSTNHKGFKVQEFEYYDGQDGKFYVIEVKKKKIIKELYFTIKGDFVREGQEILPGNDKKPEQPEKPRK